MALNVYHCARASRRGFLIDDSGDSSRFIINSLSLIGEMLYRRCRIPSFTINRRTSDECRFLRNIAQLLSWWFYFTMIAMQQRNFDVHKYIIYVLCIFIMLSYNGGKGKEKERQRERARERERERERETDRDTETETGRQKNGHRDRDIETETQRHRDTETQRQRQRHRDRDTETETQTQRQTHRDRDTDTDTDTQRQRHRHRYRNREREKKTKNMCDYLNEMSVVMCARGVCGRAHVDLAEYIAIVRSWEPHSLWRLAPKAVLRRFKASRRPYNRGRPAWRIHPTRGIAQALANVERNGEPRSELANERRPRNNDSLNLDNPYTCEHRLYHWALVLLHSLTHTSCRFSSYLYRHVAYVSRFPFHFYPDLILDTKCCV